MQSMISSPYLLKGFSLANRVVLQPMEGCDAQLDGSPDRLTEEKYLRAAKSGAGLIWMEACAVCPEGRTNPRQLMLTEENLPAFASLVEKMRKAAKEASGITPMILLQLTHSGRQSIVPMIAYRHPIYEERRAATDENIVKDEYLDTLPALYVKSALLAMRAGFDGVDVKSCHGYLFQELLSAFERAGRYGGSFENRARLYLDSIRAVKAALPEDAVLATRLSVSDMVPKPYGFGTDEAGDLDLKEPDLLLDALVSSGIDILNVTVGNPYYNPHVNRPYRKGAYVPPETAETGLARFVTIEKHIKERYPALPVVGSGLSYYRKELFDIAEAQLESGICDLVGFGRMWLAYPDFYADHQKGTFDPRHCCVACSGCTALMRAGKVSGCAVFEEYYKNLYREITK